MRAWFWRDASGQRSASYRTMSEAMTGAVNEARPRSNARLYDPIADRATVAALFRSLKRAGWDVFHEEI